MTAEVAMADALPRFAAVIFDLDSAPADTAKSGSPAVASARDLIGRLRSSGLDTAFVSARTSGAEVLAAAGGAALFDVVINGDVVSIEGANSPELAVLLEAARRLRLDPKAGVVVTANVAAAVAARAGGFGLVVGIDVGARHDDLVAAGVDMVVDDLAQLDLGAIRTDPWVLAYEGFDPGHEAHREALCALGNGYFGLS